MNSARFRIELDVDGDVGVLSVRVAGDFDTACIPMFDRVVETALATGAAMAGAEGQVPCGHGGGCVLVDVTATTMLDSAAIGALVRLRRRLVDEGRRLHVLVARPFQVRLFEITSLTEHLGVRRPDAVGGSRERPAVPGPSLADTTHPHGG